MAAFFVAGILAAPIQVALRMSKDGVLGNSEAGGHMRSIRSLEMRPELHFLGRCQKTRSHRPKKAAHSLLLCGRVWRFGEAP